MGASLQPDASAGPTGGAAENQLFYGRGTVLDEYSRTWGLRTGEGYVFERFLPSGGSLLDVGCGTGRTTFLLADRFERVDAFDIVPEMISVAQRRNRELGRDIRFFVGDAMNIPVVDRSYDAVLFAYNGIEGILSAEGQSRVLDEVFRVLRPGGGFVFTTKSCFNATYARQFYLPRLMARLGLGRHDGGSALEVTVSQHGQKLRWHTTNPIAMKRKLRRAGFEVQYFNSEVSLGRGRVEPNLASNFHRWDHFYACRKPL